MLTEQLSEMQLNMENARRKTEILEKELADKNSLISRQESRIEGEASELKSIREQLRVLFYIIFYDERQSFLLFFLT